MKFFIILIDDDDVLLDIIERAATSAFPEAQFKQLKTIQEAKEYFDNLDSSLPKLILLDIGLPDNEAGISLLATLRDNDRTFMTPIIMLTSNESGSVIRRSYSAGASSYIIKPESLAAWKERLTILRTYWLDTVTLPSK